MSFDLFVLIGKVDETVQQKWKSNLEKYGIETIFSEGFIIGKSQDEEVTVQCRLNPPLVKEQTEFEAYQFNFDFCHLDQDFKDELIQSTDDKSFKTLINSLSSELQLYSQAGRSDQALIVQCFAAASLADACDGVLFDPQEYGVVKGSEAYAVAQSHCQYEINKGLETGVKKTEAEPSGAAKKVVEKHQDPKKDKKRISVILLILLFIALRNFLMD